MFIQENVNPKKRKTGDCVIRAITKASCLKYNEVFDLLFAHTKKHGYMFNDVKCYSVIIEQLGFKKGIIKPQRGEKRPTVQELATRYPRVIVGIAKHLVGCVDGNIYDLWDCSDKSAYTFYYKEK